MEQQRVRKTYKYKLLPTPEQARTLATILWRCRELYNAGLHGRCTSLYLKVLRALCWSILDYSAW